MAAALQDVKDGMSVREASRLYNLPYETLRRRVVEKVDLECRCGPPTVLTEHEETELASYCVKMADMGFGLSRTDVMLVAFKIVEASGREHPFTDGAAGRAWFDGFRSRHPRLTLRSTQSLSRARASSANSEIVSDFFGKLGAVCAKLNILNKPMNIFNMDETGVTIIHKGGKVVTEIGRQNVWAVTSGEKGKTHTILTCVSASGFVLSPFLIYPRQRVTDNLKEGAIAGTVFHCSDSGWVNAELFLAWLHFFARSIPPSRPVLLVLDGHSSHLSIEAIEFARSNDIHMLCIPAHTTHILQPLDVGVFKSFKSFYYKACKKRIAAHPNRVITTEQIASLVGIAWPQALTPVNIMSGFKKCGIYPLDPGVVTDRQLAPSTLFHSSSSPTSSPGNKPDTSSDASSFNRPDTSPDASSVTRTSSVGRSDLSDRDLEYRKKYEEGYDIYTEDYLQWIHDNNLPSPTGSSPPLSTVSSPNCDESTNSSLSEILALPKPVAAKKKMRKPAVNAKANCITDLEVLEDLKRQKEEKKDKEKEKERRRLEKEKKKEEREKKKKEKQEERERKKQEREEKKEEIRKKKDQSKQKQPKRQTRASWQEIKTSDLIPDLQEIFSNLNIESGDSGEESEGECPGCGLVYGSAQDQEQWVQCDNCALWWDMTCADVNENIADSTFICSNCV